MRNPPALLLLLCLYTTPLFFLGLAGWETLVLLLLVSSCEVLFCPECTEKHKKYSWLVGEGSIDESDPYLKLLLTSMVLWCSVQE